MPGEEVHRLPVLQQPPQIKNPINVIEEVNYETGSVVSKTLRSGRGGNVTLFAFDEGQGLTPHTSPFDALILILEGNADVFVSDERFRASRGYLATLPANKTHSLKALSKLKMLLIMFSED